MIKDVDNVLDEKMDDLTKMVASYYTVKEVTFNSYVLNNEQCIFFQNERNPFSVWRYYVVGEDLEQNIRDAMKFFMNDHGLRPRFVLIPFNVLAQNKARRPKFLEDLPHPLEMVCQEFGLVYTIIVSDRLKNNVKGV